MVAESDHPTPRSTLKLQVHVPAVATIGSREHLGFRHGTGNPQAVGGPAEREGFHAVERDGSAGQPAIPRPPSWLNPDNSGKAAQRAAVGHLNALRSSRSAKGIGRRSWSRTSRHRWIRVPPNRTGRSTCLNVLNFSPQQPELPFMRRHERKSGRTSPCRCHPLDVRT